MFAASTVRPDIQWSVSRLAQGSKGPTAEEMKQGYQGLNYFNNTKEERLVYTNQDNTVQLFGYSDANYNKEGSSQTGWIMKLCGAAVSWASKKQTAPTLSSCEAEAVAACSATAEIIYLRRLLAEIGFPQLQPTPLLCDNRAVLDLMETDRHKTGSKHINRLNWLRHQYNEGVIMTTFVEGKLNAADMMTKRMDKATLQMCKGASGLHASPP